VLWVDKVAKDGPIVPYSFSISIEELSSRRRPGPRDATRKPPGTPSRYSEASPPVIRTTLTSEGRYGMVACVYRDYFRTAPYEAIKIEMESTRVPSDKRAVAGFEKQFGLQAWMNGRWEPVTENVVRYSQWAYFDAKPYITWSTSDSTIATIDSTGRLKALKPDKPTNVIREVIPEAIRKMNKRPVAVVAPVINVKAGEEFVIDGIRCSEPARIKVNVM